MNNKGHSGFKTLTSGVRCTSMGIYVGQYPIVSMFTVRSIEPGSL